MYGRVEEDSCDHGPAVTIREKNDRLKGVSGPFYAQGLGFLVALRFGFWLEKNDEGWGPITILRVNLKNACKIFFLAIFSVS